MPYFSLLRRIQRCWPSTSVECRISLPLRLIATSLLCLGTPSPSSIAVTPPGHRNCVVCGWHFESRLSRFSTRDCSVSPLDALPVVHLPTNRDGFINAVSPAQLPPASKTNAICVGLTSVPPPPISSIPMSSVTAADLFHLKVHLLPSI